MLVSLDDPIRDATPEAICPSDSSMLAIGAEAHTRTRI
jgi:hypothetical protein